MNHGYHFDAALSEEREAEQKRKQKEREAKKRLEAAAPDLLDACKEYSKGVLLLRASNDEIMLGAALQFKKADKLGVAAIAKAKQK